MAEVTKQRLRRQPPPPPEPRFLSEMAYEEFRKEDAIKKGLYKGPKALIPLTSEEQRLIDKRWSKLSKKALEDPKRNADLMPEKEIIEEKW